MSDSAANDKKQSPPGPTADPEACPKAEFDELEALRSGEQKAFEALVRRQGPRLLAVARRILRHEEDARDAVQEAFLSVHRKLPQFESRSKLSSWIHQILVNAALMKLRSRRRKPEEPLEIGEPKYDSVGFHDGPRRANTLTPEQLYQRSETADLVREAMLELPDSYRTVLLLRDIEGFDTKETADLLETTEGNVKVRLHRARSALKERLQPLFEEDLS